MFHTSLKQPRKAGLLRHKRHFFLDTDLNFFVSWDSNAGSSEKRLAPPQIGLSTSFDTSQPWLPPCHLSYLFLLEGIKRNKKEYKSRYQQCRDENPEMRLEQSSGASGDLHDDDEGGRANVRNVAPEAFVDERRLKRNDI